MKPLTSMIRGLAIVGFICLVPLLSQPIAYADFDLAISFSDSADPHNPEYTLTATLDFLSSNQGGIVNLQFDIFNDPLTMSFPLGQGPINFPRIQCNAVHNNYMVCSLQPGEILQVGDSISWDLHVDILDFGPDPSVYSVEGSTQNTGGTDSDPSNSHQVIYQFQTSMAFCGQTWESYDQVIEGTPTSDYLVGTELNDLILGLVGNDVIIAGKGDDCVYGGAGDDFASGRQGADEIHGGPGEDFLRGNKGNDSLFGDAGKDRIIGGAEDDSISGGEDDDMILGGTGIDTINGNEGNDFINGNKGNDTIEGDEGDDTLLGGTDDDNITGGADSDTCDAVAGIDIIDCETVL